MAVIPMIRMDRLGRISPPRPNQLAVAHVALFSAVAAFNTDRLPGLAAEDDILQIRQQIGTILLCAADLVERVANEVDGSVAASRLVPPRMAAILRDTIKDEILDPLEAVAELARIAFGENDVAERDRAYADAAE